MNESDEPSVLIVEDEPQLADLFEAFLSGDYEVQTVTSGSEALEVVDDSHDVILLDRRMPEMPGDEVLRELKRRGVDAQVGMISGIDPDVDIVKMPFDDYLTKPVNRDELLPFVETLILRSTFDDCSQEFFRLASKKAVLENSESEQTEEYQTLVDEMSALREEIDGALDVASAPTTGGFSLD